jgi:glycogen debranching enzyme
MTGFLPILKRDDTFAIFDGLGDIDSASPQPLGLFRDDTRFLSHFKLRIGQGDLLLVNATVDDDNLMLNVDLTSAQGSIRILRTRFLWNATLYERLQIQNSERSVLEQSLIVEFDADFVDLFELRGVKRRRRGRLQPARVLHTSVELDYEGLDGQVRQTAILFETSPAALNHSRARYDLRINPNESCYLIFSIRCASDTSVLRYDEAAAQLAAEVRQAKESEPEIFAENPQFNAWFNRARADLRMMLTRTPHGLYPYAGLPWYNTAFGRDGIITALECLWFDPSIARGVLAFLAATQANEENPERDAQPGKILHEARAGEMAALGEVPFGRYYGSIDATPLFVILAGAYHQRTGNTAFIESIWPNIERALFWIDNFADADGDGFYEYVSKSPRGLTNQGWKDSPEAVFYQDGTLAEPPIALCEVQAYVYGAKRSAVELARILENNALAKTLEREAEALRRRFGEIFWCEELSTYGLGLDGRKRLCRVRASNAGHCLFAGIATEERARRVVATLMDESSFSGWGIRTVAATEARFDPKSYHNGSVWPHDNALIASGFARYGFFGEAKTIFSALFDVAKFFAFRLPELFCGFPRKFGEGPLVYPAACSPQTWASCAVFLLLQSCLGLKVDKHDQEIVLTGSQFPSFLSGLTVKPLAAAGDRTADLDNKPDGG